MKPYPMRESRPESFDDLDDDTRTALEAAAFRTLVAHLRERTDVQNIDLMNLAGFCRNCLSKYLVAAAGKHDAALDYEGARTAVYGMPYADWKAVHQREATPGQQAAYDADHDAAPDAVPDAVPGAVHGAVHGVAHDVGQGAEHHVGEGTGQGTDQVTGQDKSHG